MRSIGFLFFIAQLGAAHSQTIVSGNVTGSWDLAGSPYVVVDDVTVVDSLIIEAGVQVQFDAGVYEIIAGIGSKLKARGTSAEPITFVPLTGSNPGSWGRIRFHGSGNDDTLRYCRLLYATDGVMATGDNFSPSAQPSIEHCEIAYASQHGILANEKCDPWLTECAIHHNGGAGVRVYSYDYNPHATIHRCRIHHNGTVGVEVLSAYDRSADAKVINCSVVANGTSGITSTEYFPGSSTVFADVVNSIVAFNGSFGFADAGDDTDIGNITSNCFWANGSGAISGVSGPGFGQTGPYLNNNGDSSDVNLNIYYDPMFCDTSDTTDLVLSISSPCIDAGTPAILGTLYYDPDATVPDLGAVWPAVVWCGGVGIAERTDPGAMLHIYPTPASGSITITIPTGMDGEILILDALGRPVVVRSINSTLSLDISQLASGRYSVVFTAADLEQLRGSFFIN